jgi:hypothetical protein
MSMGITRDTFKLLIRLNACESVSLNGVDIEKDVAMMLVCRNPNLYDDDGDEDIKKLSLTSERD